MTRTWGRWLATLSLITFGVAVSAACEDESSTTNNVRQETRKDLESLRNEVRNEINPSRKEQILKRCVTVAERLQRTNDADAAQMTDFCRSIEQTDPNTQAAWEDVRARLDQLIQRFRT